MTEKEVQPWVAVNQFMDDEFKEIVIDTAFEHFPEASKELHIFAKRTLSKAIKVPGFRTFDRVPQTMAKRYVNQKFDEDNSVTTVVICLWAEAQEKLIDKFRSSAEAAGLHFIPDCSWTKNGEGFSEYEDIPKLDAFANEFIEEISRPESDHYMLAVLWLSRLLVAEEEEDIMDDENRLASTETDQVDDDIDANGDGQLDNEQIHETNLPEEIHQKASETEEGSDQGQATAPGPEKESFETLQNIWLTYIDADINARTAASTQAQKLQSTIAADDLKKTKTIFDALQSGIEEWQRKRLELSEFSRDLIGRLKSEYERRPDLRSERSLGYLMSKDAKDFTWTISQAQLGVKSLEALLDYDHKKGVYLQEINKIQAAISSSYESVAIWQDEIDEFPQLPSDIEIEELPLDQVIEKVENSKKIEEELRSICGQFRELSGNRIIATIDKIKEIVPETQDLQVAGYQFQDLEHLDLTKLPDLDLRNLEIELVEEFNSQLAKSQPGESTELAEGLIASWNEEKLADLLRGLAFENRDVEAFLTEFAAATVHPRNTPAIYPTEVAKSILNGLGHLSSKDQPFELLNLVTTTFFSSWKAGDPQSQAEICLIALAAYFSGTHRLPDGFLWQIETEWPLENMPNWIRLWQSALLEEPNPIYTDQKQQDLAEILNQKSKESEQLFARDGGHYIRLGSLRSSRHSVLLSSQLMPKLERHFEQIQKLETEIKKSHPEQLPGNLAKLSTYLSDQLCEELSDENLVEWYESGLYESGIDDTDPFPRKVSLRILNDCAQTILDYAQALLKFGELSNSRSSALSGDNLSNELSKIEDLTTMGKAAFEQIIKSQGKDQLPWDATYSEQLIKRWIIREALGQVAYAMRLPHLVGHFANEDVNWEKSLDTILLDISQPADPATAASILLEVDAPNQALLLTQHIPLEIQKQAQTERQELERKVNRLETELVELGGSIDELAQDRDLGRWGYVSKALGEEVTLRRELLESQKRDFQERSLAYFSQINELEFSIFKAKEEMPQEAFRIISRGLISAKRALETESLFPDIEAYLKEIHYRLDHRSWPLKELLAATEHIEKNLSGTMIERDPGMTAEKLLDYLETRQLDKIGLSDDEFFASQINTRIDILRNWMSVKGIRSIIGKELLQSDISSIQALFRYFAQMMAMKRYRGADGEAMEYIYPLVYEYWQLKYPKTSALVDQCIFIALPGEPPTPQNIRILADFLDDKEFLDYYFVFLFIPGCTQKVANRLRLNYAKRGMVLIDEEALLRMVLAEADGNKPLGRLRPMMLNSKEANADIFTVNQSVNERTAIFVGRKPLIDRIVSSGDNYALYGGRRIGKSSVLQAIEERLQRRGIKTVSLSLEGEKDHSDRHITSQLIHRMGLTEAFEKTNDFKLTLSNYLEENPDTSMVVLLDEIDRYIQINLERHTLIEALRASSDQFGDRFRVIIAGFMGLYDCLKGRGPYTPNSDPWGRMLNDNGPLENLRASNAEDIVKEGFIDILGWDFDNRSIPQLIVMHTGGHPAFVQFFCLRLMERVRKRGDQRINLRDVKEVFDDQHPGQSFVAYVRATLRMNLSDPVSRYLIPWLASEYSEAQGFTWGQIREIAELSEIPIPENHLVRSLELLKVTSVVKERAPQLYDFTVPDYPSMLNRLGETAHLEKLEDELDSYLKEHNDAVQ